MSGGKTQGKPNKEGIKIARASRVVREVAQEVAQEVARKVANACGYRAARLMRVMHVSCVNDDSVDIERIVSASKMGELYRGLN